MFTILYCNSILYIMLTILYCYSILYTMLTILYLVCASCYTQCVLSGGLETEKARENYLAKSLDKVVKITSVAHSKHYEYVCENIELDKRHLCARTASGTYMSLYLFLHVSSLVQSLNISPLPLAPVNNAQRSYQAQQPFSSTIQSSFDRCFFGNGNLIIKNPVFVDSLCFFTFFLL